MIVPPFMASPPRRLGMAWWEKLDLLIEGLSEIIA